MDDLIKAMSVEELEKFKAGYMENESIQRIVDGYITIKQAEVVQARAMEDFGKAIGKVADKLVHPEGIYNVYLAWMEVEAEDTSQPAIEVEVIIEQAVVDGEGTIITPAVKGMESRHPMVKVWKWAVELNKGFSVQKSGSATSTSSSKRAITVKLIHSDKAPELIGNFRSAKEACVHLNLIVGTDSAMRVLTNRNPYMVVAYEGTDFTVSES